MGVVLTCNPDLGIGHHIVTLAHHLKDKVVANLILHQIVFVGSTALGDFLVVLNQVSCQVGLGNGL